MIGFLKRNGFKESVTNGVDDLRDKQFTLLNVAKDKGGQYATLGYEGVIETTQYLLKLNEKSYKDNLLNNMVLSVNDEDDFNSVNFDSERDENGYLITITFTKEY